MPNPGVRTIPSRLVTKNLILCKLPLDPNVILANAKQKDDEHFSDKLSLDPKVHRIGLETVLSYRLTPTIHLVIFYYFNMRDKILLDYCMGDWRHDISRSFPKVDDVMLESRFTFSTTAFVAGAVQFP